MQATSSAVAVTHSSAAHRHTSKRRKLHHPDEVVEVGGRYFAPSANIQQHEDRQEVAHGLHEYDKPITRHPLGVKPLGNIYGSKVTNLRAHCGTFCNVPDEFLSIFLEYLEAQDLLRLGATCKALYAFCKTDDLWKQLFIQSKHVPEAAKWRGSWRSTYLELLPEQDKPIDCTGLFSDVLFRPFHCAHAPLKPFTRNIPPQNRITRLPNLTAEEYDKDWADKPFILTEPVKSWPVYQHWSTQALLKRQHETIFRAEAVDWPFATYAEYMHRNSDESPLYLFDCRFAEKMGLNIGDTAGGGDDSNVKKSADYTPPDCFSPDLFTCLGSSRPDHRWLIIGPPRSGSTFHQDPNGTSAWNAIIHGGAKYWLMFPPSPAPLPPGIHVSSDSSHITAPLSIMEYLLTFHEEARRQAGCIEAICYPGEVLHVPAGWYHMVVNLEPDDTDVGVEKSACIALTQNFVSKRNLADVLSFLRDKPEQISGFRGSNEENPYELFVQKLQESFPAELAEAMCQLERRDAAKAKKTKWEVLTGNSNRKKRDNSGDDDHYHHHGAGNGEQGFSFGFGFGNNNSDEDEGGLE